MGTMTQCEALFKATEGRLFAFLFGLTRNREDAEDLVQETFMRAYRAEGQGNGAVYGESWIRMIALNAFRDQLRKKKRRIQELSFELECGDTYDPEDDAPTAEQMLLRSTLPEPVDKALRSLTPAERDLVLAASMEDAEISSIGDSLGWPPRKVRSRLQRAYTAMRRHIASQQSKELN